MLSRQLRPGSKVGRYDLLRALGGGAGGTVFEANDAVLSRRVAVKVFHVAVFGGSTPEQSEARFLREGRIACRIRHTNVVDVFDCGVHEGVPFLVMEFVDGESLAQLLLRERALALGTAIDIVLPVLSAVAGLHAKGVVHRDIKPANVLLPAGVCGRPKLADFGVSRLTEDVPASGQTWAPVGTLDYLAPELARDGRADEERADQYALGVLLYECVTGQKPFSGATEYELIHATVSCEFVPPSSRAPGLPAVFDGIVRRAMDRDPQRRFPSVEALAEALVPLASEGARARYRSELPVPRPSSRPPSIAPGATPDGCEGAPPRVLIVDDDELNLRTFRRAFRGDFEVSCAASGPEALDLLAVSRFDVALVDYAMPGMSGVGFLRAARVLRPDLAAVMVTAHADLPEVRGALAGGAVHAVIMKPFERETILRWVTHCHRLATMRKSVGAMMSQLK